MSVKRTFDDKQAFLDALRESAGKGVPRDKIRVYTPYDVHEVRDILHPEPSGLKYFTLLGALAGLLVGFAFTIFTSLHWPLMTGGKPIVSIPAYIIVAFELTILFGAAASFTGFLILSRLPSVERIIEPEEPGPEFVIIEDFEEDLW